MTQQLIVPPDDYYSVFLATLATQERFKNDISKGMEIYNRLKREGKIGRSDAIETRQLAFQTESSLSSAPPALSFSIHPSRTNYTLAMEGLLSAITDGASRYVELTLKNMEAALLPYRGKGTTFVQVIKKSNDALKGAIQHRNLIEEFLRALGEIIAESIDEVTTSKVNGQIEKIQSVRMGVAVRFEDELAASWSKHLSNVLDEVKDLSTVAMFEGSRGIFYQLTTSGYSTLDAVDTVFQQILRSSKPLTSKETIESFRSDMAEKYYKPLFKTNGRLVKFVGFDKYFNEDGDTDKVVDFYRRLKSYSVSVSEPGAEEAKDTFSLQAISLTEANLLSHLSTEVYSKDLNERFLNASEIIGRVSNVSKRVIDTLQDAVDEVMKLEDDLERNETMKSLLGLVSDLNKVASIGICQIRASVSFAANYSLFIQTYEQVLARELKECQSYVHGRDFKAGLPESTFQAFNQKVH